jgi:hypothetical protein
MQFAIVAGGGADVKVTRRLAVRLAADWLHGFEHHPSSAEGAFMPTRNTFRFQTGVVVGLGR